MMEQIENLMTNLRETIICNSKLLMLKRDQFAFETSESMTLDERKILVKQLSKRHSDLYQVSKELSSLAEKKPFAKDFLRLIDSQISAYLLDLRTRIKTHNDIIDLNRSEFRGKRLL